jgi:hypothetical protein
VRASREGVFAKLDVARSGPPCARSGTDEERGTDDDCAGRDEHRKDEQHFKQHQMTPPVSAVTSSDT